MRTSHFCRTNRSNFGCSRHGSDAVGSSTARYAYLTGMEPNTTPDASVHQVDDVVVGGVFEPAFSITELADQLHVSRQTLYDLRSQGRGPTGFRIGRHLRFRQSEVAAWLTRLEEEDLDRHEGSAR